MKRIKQINENIDEVKKLSSNNQRVVKYKCEKCDSILFEGSDDISGFIRIICKAKVHSAGNSCTKKCKHINMFKGAKNV